MADPEIAKRNARRNYKTTANEEFDASDERKKESQPGAMAYKGAGERNANGDTLPHWMFAEPNQRNLRYDVNRGERQSRREALEAGDYGAVPKYAKGGGVTNFKDDHCGHADMKRGGSVKGKC